MSGGEEGHGGGWGGEVQSQQSRGLLEADAMRWKSRVCVPQRGCAVVSAMVSAMVSAVVCAVVCAVLCDHVRTSSGEKRGRERALGQGAAEGVLFHWMDDGPWTMEDGRRTTQDPHAVCHARVKASCFRIRSVLCWSP